MTDITAWHASVQPEFTEKTKACLTDNAGSELAVTLILYWCHITGPKRLDNRIIRRINRRNRIFPLKPIAKVNIGAARRTKGACFGIGWRTAGWASWQWLCRRFCRRFCWF
jgi:hypothetical protein